MASKAELLKEFTEEGLDDLAAQNDVELEGTSESAKRKELESALTAAQIKAYSKQVDEEEDSEPSAEADDVSPTSTMNVAGSGNSQLGLAPPMKDESGSNLPAPNLRQPLAGEGATASASPQGLDPNLVDPDKAAVERVKGRTSDASTRKEGTQIDEVPADIGAGSKPSDGGAERYPFPQGGDVEVATVKPGKGKGEYMLPLEIEDWVVLDGSHELVPDRLDGRRAAVLDAPRYLIPESAKAETWITVRTRDEVNATLSIPLTAVKEVQRNGVAPTVRG